MSEDMAYLRIRAARAARRFPAIFERVADGQLHLSGVVLLAPFLTTENAAELLEAAAHRFKAEIRAHLAERFPRPDLPARVEPILVAGPVANPQLVPDPVATPVPQPRLTPLARERFAMQLTIGKATHDKLCHAQALLGHRIPSGDLAAVLDLALDALIERLEKRKFAKTSKPRPRTCRSSNPRHIPAHVKRAVWERDGARCTFVSESGRRCTARRFLEYDHVTPVARGGQATLANIRLRCRMHNQHDAERMFGAGFMSEKRAAACLASGGRRAATGLHACDAGHTDRASTVSTGRLGTRAHAAKPATRADPLR